MAVYISENGFITLTLCAIETSIKYEASGILLGYQAKGTYYVENVIPYQIAERSSDSVYVHPARQRRIRRVFENYMKYKIIGEFHTHPDGVAELSDDDNGVIRSSDYKLEIVVAVNLNNSKNNSKNTWAYKKGFLSGSIDKYELVIAAWKVGRDKMIKQLLTCPFAVGFD